jgi:hypothetical protein
MPDLNERYEAKLRRHIAITNRRIQQAYISAIQDISNQIDKIRWNGQVFSLNQFPLLKQKIEAVIDKMHPQVYGALVNSIKSSWDLSNEKNNIIVDRRIAERRPNKRVQQVLYDPNMKARDSFISRTEKGLKLSNRVWNTLEPFKSELEAGLGMAVTNGIGAKATAKELKKYLQDPDKLFRRVRENGKLRLSSAAKAYHPGQGVYRSSYKNSLRLSRTENNMAYRTADYERWSNLPFVVGIEVKLSAAHPRYDICDRVKGLYPKDFKFVGWHPQCLCYQVPKMMSDEEYDRMEDAILAGEEPDLEGVTLITKPPAGFNEYVRENRKRIEGWNNTPYWVKDNLDYFDNAGPVRLPKVKAKLIPGGKPVQAQFTNIQKSISGPVNEALSSIDKVHGDGDLKDIPFKKVRADYEAAFLRRQGAPVEIHLSSTATSPSFSLVHEMGHYFDLHSIGTPGRYESEIDGTRLSKIVEIAKKSETIQKIQGWLKEGVAKFGEKEVPVSLALRNHFNYLLYPREIWARAYSQFVAKRSGTEAMLKGVSEMVSYNGVPYQWADGDFEEIEKAIEKYFFDIGWIVSQ